MKSRRYGRFLAWSNSKHRLTSDPWPTGLLRRAMDRIGWWGSRKSERTDAT